MQRPFICTPTATGTTHGLQVDSAACTTDRHAVIMFAADQHLRDAGPHYYWTARRGVAHAGLTTLV